MSGLEGVFEVNFVYRAEKSTSNRHLTEFTGVDVEFAWCFETEEEMVKAGLAALKPFVSEVKDLFGVELTTEPSVIYMTLDEAKAILKEHGVMSLGKDTDLPDEGERMLYEIVKKDLIFVSDYPIAKRPFYHMWEPEKGTTKSFDLIFKGIEITSGAIREHRYDKFIEQVRAKGVSLESVESYSEMFRYGVAPHGGF